MTLNKDLLETSQIYREIAALDCFEDIPFEIENENHNEINNDDEFETQQEEEDFWEWDEEKQCWVGGI